MNNNESHIIPSEITLFRKFGNTFISHSSLKDVISEYQRPNDKISNWIKKGVLIPLRRGLYVLGNSYRERPISLGVASNLIYGPSYVSLDYALSIHGLIPERVEETSAVTTKRSRDFDTYFGRFSYMHLPMRLYPIGIQNQKTADGQYYLIASPEKSLCDKIILTRNLDISSVIKIRKYLFEDLRIEESDLKNLDKTIVAKCLQSGYHSARLPFLYKLMESL